MAIAPVKVRIFVNFINHRAAIVFASVYQGHYSHKYSYDS